MNAAKETSEDDEDKQPIAFMNFDCAALIKDNSGVTQILNTGASTHMTPHKNLLADYKKFPKPRKVHAADKGTFEALGSGMLVMPIKIHGRDVNVMLKDMLYAPDIAFTLISIGKCDDAGYQTVFAQQKCIVKDSNGKTLFEAPKFHGLYQLDHEPAQAMACSCLPAVEIHR